MTTYRYSRWDGSQQFSPLPEEDVMDQLAEYLMAHGDVAEALRSLAQRGVGGREGQRLPGVQELLQRLRSQRQATLSKYNLGAIMDSLAGKLQDILDTERRGIQQRLEEASARAEAKDSPLPGKLAQDLLSSLRRQADRSNAFLDQLPKDPPGRIQQLQGYEFMDPQARDKFQALLDSLQKPVLDSHLDSLSKSLHGMSPQDKDRLKDMLADLNHMLEQRLKGVPPTEFDRFRRQYGDMFGQEPPNSLDDLLEQVQRQAGRMRSLLRSLTPAQRQDLQDAMDAALGDPEMQEELAQLRAHLEALGKKGDSERDYPFHGDEPVTLQEALEVMERLQQIEDSERQLRRMQHGGSLQDVDRSAIKEILGEEAAQQLEQIRTLGEMLERAGYIRKGERNYELTPLGTRKVGQKAMQEIFSHIRKAQLGGHPVSRTGISGLSQRESTKRYEYGDAFEPHLQRTLMNAVQRSGDGVPLKLTPADFEVYSSQETPQAATVLLVDMSLSMVMRGNFLAAKKVALALNNLIRTQFPRDSLHIVGFSTYARDIKPENLPYLGWDEFDPYTNIQHGLALAQKLLARSPSSATRQIIMVSDGEPTAHLENGQLFLQYPPSPRTLRETLLEVQRCTQQRITINTFMLDSNPHLREFVDRMTRINRGRVFYTGPEQLGRYLLVDYFASRRLVLR
ncbi:MAG: VWA domain-containing protein [Chloroflexi bacterium]|nr:VWA domain-containing protein [Chloroflexota bacterium]